MRKTYLTFLAGTIVVLAATMAAAPALAHTGGSLSGFGAGLTHPLLGFDHMLAMLAVGLWSATQPGNKAWQGPALFVGLLALGSLFGLAVPGLPLVEPGIVASVIVLGVMVVAAHRLPANLGLVAIGGFALLHGHAHGAEATGAVAGYMAGFMIASTALHLAGYGLGHRLSKLGYALPAAGLGIATAGLVLAGG